MKNSSFSQKFSQVIVPHTILLGYVVIVLFPISVILINAFKTRKAIFNAPLMPPLPDTFSLEGFQTVFARANFPLYFVNSLTVTIVSLFLILLTGAMAAYALSEYRFPGNTLMALYLANF